MGVSKYIRSSLRFKDKLNNLEKGAVKQDLNEQE